jgi:hypothetical protein
MFAELNFNFSKNGVGLSRSIRYQCALSWADLANCDDGFYLRGNDGLVMSREFIRSWAWTCFIILFVAGYCPCSARGRLGQRDVPRKTP